ncbi:transcriptional regulator, AraC family [Beutenbergia cavernae DSM 12333]|uniref:Transcriptional regulator, AraC family n=1 Tax=Beutenbergia cavernae (strain ATCC BAA-8 / DSM 12333 / CCUG 43141 / JCM 11478 / NBRC 16432 / NCIMB 13614 / HKI 0122) TaxID=471853 RepID=C5BUW4_BEUC1|nr:AraC family transcriptional regulator [Beutenbergia cavernae]ACQ78338.1 transcriptional regulator, AraC family [Beutenbergia cavernae DSM 12333]
MDVLSDVLLAVRLTGAVYFDIEARSPFVAESPPTDKIAAKVAVDADHLIAFHVLTSGSCWVEAVDEPEPAVLLRAGEMVIFSSGEANILASAPGMRGQPDASRYYRPVNEALPFVIDITGDAAADRCRIVCGYLACDKGPFNPLLDSLPRMVHAPVSERSWGWMTSLLDAAIVASDERDAGQEAMLAKLSELMFVEALKTHIEGLPADTRNWVAGLRDREIGSALRLMHGRFAEPWTLEHLARDVGMSRSSLAERFTAYVGVPPMTYLARWRLQLAARLLQSGSGVAQAASAVGYQSESAFNRAFKRQVGEAPGVWRRRLRA